MDGDWMRGIAQGFVNKVPSRTKVSVKLEGRVPPLSNPILGQLHTFPKHASGIQGYDFHMIRVLDLPVAVALGSAAAPG